MEEERRQAIANMREEQDNICDICKRERKDEEFVVHVSPLGPVRGNICKECLESIDRETRREKRRRYYEGHRESCLAKMKEWQRNNREKINERQRAKRKA